MGADCKSVGESLHRFESCTCHTSQAPSSRGPEVFPADALSQLVANPSKPAAIVAFASNRRHTVVDGTLSAIARGTVAVVGYHVVVCGAGVVKGR